MTCLSNLLLRDNSNATNRTIRSVPNESDGVGAPFLVGDVCNGDGADLNHGGDHDDFRYEGGGDVDVGGDAAATVDDDHGEVDYDDTDVDVVDEDDDDSISITRLGESWMTISFINYIAVVNNTVHVDKAVVHTVAVLMS